MEITELIAERIIPLTSSACKSEILPGASFLPARVSSLARILQQNTQIVRPDSRV